MATIVSTDPSAAGEIGEPLKLRRTVGFWGLSFVSLGSIIGSGWLLGALTAASIAGGASLISWILAVLMLMVLALIHADLGAAYPVAGGTARYPHYAFGGLAGFTAGWVTYLQAVAIAPLEVEASIGYVNALPAVHSGFNMLNTDGTLNGLGLIIGVLALALFTYINLMGARLMSDSNTGIVLWKIFVPVLTIIVLLVVAFHPGNFSAGGGFMPYGWHGVFAALPAGVVFALQGFEQATQMAGEAKDPRKHLAKAIILAMVIGAVIYLLLEVAFIGALDPANLVDGWAHPIAKGDYGPYYTLAITSGIGWLAIVLMIDAVISPGGTGLIYIGTTARISYALGLPKSLTKVSKRGVPIWSVLLAAVLGVICLAPSSSWQTLVGLVTGATAIMYAFAPISLAALRKADPGREHPYQSPIPGFLLPVGFFFANLIIYWGGFNATWQLLIGVALGQAIFIIAGFLKPKSVDMARANMRSLIWIYPWLLGMLVIGWVGNYGGGLNLLWPNAPAPVDALVVLAWSLLIFYFAVSRVQETSEILRSVEMDKDDTEIAGLEPATT